MSRAIHKLNARRLSALSEQGWHGDGGGLWLRVSKDGSKRWVFVWTREKKRREMGLGAYRDTPLADVRDMAAVARKIVQEGGDPIEMRWQAAADEASSRQRELASLDVQSAPTFRVYAEQYISEHEESWSNEKHRWQWSNCLTKHAADLLEKPVNEISADDVVGILKPIWHVIAETAGRVRTRIESILDAARAQGHIASPWENPARWKGNLEHRLPRRKRLAQGHYNALPYEEMPDFFAELRQRPAPAARALELTILCATRTSETLKMRWSEVDLAKAIWTVPALRMKMRVEHRIPLSDAALRLLNSLKPSDVVPGDKFVFPGRVAGKSLSQMSMAMVMRRMKLGHFTVHGMRSSFRDYMGDMTPHEENVIEHALAHQVGDSTARAYRRKDAFEKRKLVMSDWAAYLTNQEKRSDQESSAIAA